MKSVLVGHLIRVVTNSDKNSKSDAAPHNNFANFHCIMLVTEYCFVFKSAEKS